MQTHPPARRCARQSQIPPRSRPFFSSTPALFIVLATLLTFGGVHAAVVIGTVALLAFLPHLRRTGGLVLQAHVGHGAPVAARPPSGWLRWFGGGSDLRLPAEHRPQVGRPAQERPLTGARGVTLSDLRLSGTADIQGRQVDVVTNGVYITAGEAITVVTDEGYRRVVRRVTRAAD